VSASADQRALSGENFLAALADDSRPPIALRTAVVVAHPDDETIGCGALLARLPDVTVIHVTDGAPRNGIDSRALGFATSEAYTAARRAELQAAMELAGIEPARLIGLGCPDQEASARLPWITRELVRHFAGTEIVLTHAYEGGHPDHDATAFAVHAACRSLGAGAPAVLEMPLYRAGPNGWLKQSFGSGTSAETIVVLSQAERARKQAMFTAHASQASVLAGFAIETEPFRLAPDYDFTRPPNGGDVLYESQNWGMTGDRWLDLSRAALSELGMAGRS
jgi:LmbE family N-acetylglucosaminyl deacetylase